MAIRYPNLLTAILIFTVLMFPGYPGIAKRKCNCQKVLESLTASVEVNSASYARNILEAGKIAEYNAHKEFVMAQAADRKYLRDCIGLVTIYLSLFEDSHQKVYGTPAFYDFASLADTIGIRKFAREYSEVHPVPELEKTDSLSGLWYHAGQGYSVFVFPESSFGRSHLGIRKDSPSKGFPGGDVKMEFLFDSHRKLKCLFWAEWYQSEFLDYELSKDSLRIGRDLLFVRKKPNPPGDKMTGLEPTSFRELNEQVNYLSIRSFDYRYKDLIDSLMDFNHDKVIQKEHLIIDLRGNPGGSDLCFESIMPYVFETVQYTEPLAGSIWVSQENLRGYEQERYDYGVMNKNDSLEADREIAELRKYLGKFEPLEFKERKLDQFFSSPRRIHLLIDKNCASTTETFVLTAMESPKVQVYGEATRGAIQFGEWRPIQLEKIKSWVSLTQKKFETSSGEQYEMVGIKPNVSFEGTPPSTWLNTLLSSLAD